MVALSYWLPHYACETHMRARNKYPASIIFGLLGGLLRRMRAISELYLMIAQTLKILGLKRCIPSLTLIFDNLEWKAWV